MDANDTTALAHLLDTYDMPSIVTALASIAKERAERQRADGEHEAADAWDDDAAILLDAYASMT